MYEPPPGYTDMLDDAEDAPTGGPYRPLEVEGVGTVRARKPMPRSAAALAMSANSKLGLEDKVGYLNLFVRNHLDEGEFEELLRGMVAEELPPDAVQRVARAIATWGTARPTQPSSR